MLHEGWELGDVVGTDHDVDERRLAQELLAFRRGHAARHDHDEVGLDRLEALVRADDAAELLLGLLAHAAGVEDDDVGERGLVGRLVAMAFEHFLDSSRIVDVHLAAEGLYEVTLHGENGRPS